MKRYLLILPMLFMFPLLSFGGTDGTGGESPEKKADFSGSAVSVSSAERILMQSPVYSSANRTWTKTKGYTGTAEVSGRVGIGRRHINSTTVHLINGYLFNPCFSMGIGTGIDFHYVVRDDPSADIKEFSVPFFLNARIWFNRKAVSPYFSLNAGYNAAGKNHYHVRGYLLNPSFGLSFVLKSDSRARMNFGAGYALQQTGDIPTGADNRKRMTHAVSFGLGFSF